MVSWGKFTIKTAKTNNFSITFTKVPITFSSYLPNSFNTNGISNTVFINNITTTGFNSATTATSYEGHYLAIGS